jgi:PTS system N-acetylglucosamine-specific IIC component
MLSYLQKIGKSLMVPVAVLPAAALLMGVGYWIDPTGEGNQLAALLLKAGGSLIDNMGILFAVGVAFGMSKDNHGSAALTGLVSWLVIQTLLAPEAVSVILGIDIDSVPLAFNKVNNQFIGILTGVIAATVYNKTYKTELPMYLSFFSGRRLSAIVVAAVSVVVAFILMFVWPFVFGGLVAFGETISSMGAVGAGLYGFFNRLLIPVGLHHALNSVFWFDVAGINDIPNYLAGATELSTDTYTVGMYQAGFFPIMMFGLPAAAYAMYTEALESEKKRVGGILMAAAVASFFTGVTEPLEFLFMFTAPLLFFVHAVYTGLSLFISAHFGWIAGFGFSAGFVDYFLSFKNPAASNNLMLIVQGIGFAFLYFFTFKLLIRKFDLKTIGRTVDEETANDDDETVGDKHSRRASHVVDIVGLDNIVEIDNCATRLRLVVKDSESVDAAKIKSAGFPGTMKPSKTTLQIIVGPDVEFVADALKAEVAKRRMK